MRRFRVSDLTAGFLLGFASLLLIFLFSSDIAAHYEVCEVTKDGAKVCVRYGVIGFVFREIGIFLDSYNGLITAIATAFIAWFTLSLRQSTDKLWDAGERQLKLLTGTSAVQSRDMQDSIEVSRRAAIATENAFTLTQRAFVFVRDARIDIFKDQNGTISYFASRIVWENSGDTPTKNLRTHFNVVLFPTVLPDNFAFPDLNPSGGILLLSTTVATLIGPKASSTTMAIHILPDHLKDVRDGKRHLYVYGWAEYNDIFPGTKRHRTEFCHKWLISGDITAPEKFHANFTWYNRYNGADEDCIKPLQTT
jgi:hypothetical protein